MKNRTNKFMLPAFLVITNICMAQQINWKTLKRNPSHIAYINLGWDYSMVTAVGYGQLLKTKMPVVLNLDFSTPFGKKLLDDLKTKLGGQAQLIHFNNFFVSAKAYGLFRAYQNSLVKLASFGSEFSGNIGYYKPRWYLAGEFGFDKAITTHIKNTGTMKSIYPNIQDGWYLHSGGNFFYGITYGHSFKLNDINVKIGKDVTQDFRTAPALPLYFSIGFNRKF